MIIYGTTLDVPLRFRHEWIKFYQNYISYLEDYIGYGKKTQYNNVVTKLMVNTMKRRLNQLSKPLLNGQAKGVIK